MKKAYYSKICVKGILWHLVNENLKLQQLSFGSRNDCKEEGKEVRK